MENTAAVPADLEQQVSQMLAESMITTCAVLRSMDAPPAQAEQVYTESTNTCMQDISSCSSATSAEEAAACLRSAICKRDA